MANDPFAPYHKLSINVNRETAETLQQIAEDKGVSITEAVRRAVALLKYIDDSQKAGMEVQVRNGRSVMKLELL
ncbi:MAG TPA: ribbon-helix-helix domain-containing protein [Burkholderiales bacterium]|nr:ribbon-helix-helix domain-containing protein [Burkholderiales bacterium]